MWLHLEAIMASLGGVKRPTGAPERPSFVCFAWKLHGTPCLELAIGDSRWCAKHQALAEVYGVLGHKRPAPAVTPAELAINDPYVSGALA